MRLIEGREFDNRDHIKSQPVAIINASMAKRHGEAARSAGTLAAVSPTNSRSWAWWRIRANGLRVEVPPMAYLADAAT